MPRTQVRSAQLGDGEVKRADLNTTTTGDAVVRKIAAGTNCTIGSTGVDAGTGDVTINVPGVAKASGAGTVDTISVADPSVGGAALLIQGVAGGDVFFNIGDAGLTGFANETRFGIGTSTTVESEAFGFGAAAVSQAVAMGTSSYALNGVAIGWSSYTAYGVAVGYNSNALAGSTAIGQVASGDSYSVSIGPNTSSGDNGVAIGRFANAHGAGCVAIAGDPGATLPATVPFGYTDTVQLGRGTSTINGGLHFRGWAVVNASGKIADLTSAGAGIGYSTGAGGVVTQITSRTTGVTINKISGAITTDTSSLAASTSAIFTVTNSLVAIGDVVHLSIRSGQSSTSIATVSSVAAGSFNITISNLSLATAETGAIIINFAVFKATSA